MGKFDWDDDEMAEALKNAKPAPPKDKPKRKPKKEPKSDG